ncbi:calcium-transporting ATPase 12, plasma membrane-type isoform X2 [Humulus lupulus]|uniref:calcium-transporting ATPase 12, plasma membrane-type isoform X2 n=1 Tax=Humulus lupulus TaxID=3486 RepID=UPI002B403CE5|nr:calcium-transporting ATPase 12, plasma membrane-type isoform X2 [Humulus lupulus]
MSIVTGSAIHCGKLLFEYTRAQKRWRMAYKAIYFVRIMLSLPKHVIVSEISIYKNCSETLLSPSKTPNTNYTSTTTTTTTNHEVNKASKVSLVPDVDYKLIMEIVKEKDLVNLRVHGGIETIAISLGTDPENGIHEKEEDIEKRRQVFGSNTYHKPPPKGLFYFVVDALKDTTILILMVCAALALGFGIKEHGGKEGWYEGGSIFIAVVLVIVGSALSNYRQETQFDKLSKISDNIKIEVVRGGRRQEISIFHIVVGDVVLLNIGDQIPADGLFLSGHSLLVDESSMTGESDHIEIDSVKHPFLFSGSKVADGYGTMLVISVGMNTTWGEMMSSITRDTNERTPLQARLDKLTSSIGKVGLTVASLVLVVMLVRYFTGNTKNEFGNKEYIKGRTDVDNVLNAVVRIVAAAVTIVVVAIPEGLPLAVTLTLAYSMKRMMADQAMVRKLSACETMGSATIICTDKTGTLTLNQMKVTKFWLGQEQINEEDDSNSISTSVRELFYQGVGLNTTGAAEMVLAMCSSYYDSNGDKKSLDEEVKKKFEKIIEGMAASSLRCIAFAQCEVSEDEIEYVDDQEKTHRRLKEDKLTLLGIVGLKDPCRPGVKKAVEACRYAGVAIKMITGDNVFTAKAIAAECGILEAATGDEVTEGQVVEGIEFRNYTLEDRMKKIDNIRVMARSSPFDKLLMVQCLKAKGHVVAVTGDGTNDAPALKEADIGLSMGIQGTEVAKESSDIVILDDNFASVVTVLRWGRCVYNNIQKFIQFQLTVNVAALVINFIAAVSAGEVPLTAVQLLWVNLIMDTLGALALATERPSNELMKKRPVGRTAPLITNIMWRNLLAQSLYQIAILLFLQFNGESIFHVSKEVNDTLIFNTFVLCQVFNEFNSRSMEKKNVFKGVHRNKLFMGIIGFTIVLQVVMVEFLKKFADTTNLNWWQWLGCIAIAAVSWPIGWFVKSIPVSNEPLLDYLRRVFKFKRITKIFHRTENSTSRLGRLGIGCGKC